MCAASAPPAPQQPQRETQQQSGDAFTSIQPNAMQNVKQEAPELRGNSITLLAVVLLQIRCE